MSTPNNPSDTTWPAAIITLLSGVGLALFRWWPRRRRERAEETNHARAQDATVETAYLSAIEQMRADWRSEVQLLRAEVAQLRMENQALHEELVLLKERLRLLTES